MDRLVRSGRGGSMWGLVFIDWFGPCHRDMSFCFFDFPVLSCPFLLENHSNKNYLLVCPKNTNRHNTKGRNINIGKLGKEIFFT